MTNPRIPQQDIDYLFNIRVIDIPYDDVRKRVANARAEALSSKKSLFEGTIRYLNQEHGKVPRALTELLEGSDFVYNLAGNKDLCEDFGLSYANIGPNELYTLRAAIINWIAEKMNVLTERVAVEGHIF